MKKLLVLTGLLFFLGLGMVSAKQTEMNFLEKLQFNKLDFPDSQFVKEATEKKQIVLHHTASGRGIDGDYNTWLNNKERIATSVIIDSNGVVNQLFSSAYWGYHLGIKQEVFTANRIPYQLLDKTSIGVEIDSWGGIKQVDGEWRTYVNDFGKGKLTDKQGKPFKVVLNENCLTFYSNGFKGYEAFERYTDAQINSTYWLLKHWEQKYNIPLSYNADIWDVSARALNGDAGVFTHNSYRKDKSDVHPQPELINMLKTLG